MTPRTKDMKPAVTTLLGGLTFFLTMLPAAMAAETRGYVVSSFSTATYDIKENCPQGGAPNGDGLRERLLMELGYSSQTARKMMTDGVTTEDEFQRLLSNRSKVGGQPASVYNYPMAAPDPHLETVQGRFAYGFNLDGKVSSNDFTDPETQELGIDNQLFRAVGCLVEFRVNWPQWPFYQHAMWDTVTDTMPAWIISITADDFARDGKVTITLGKALQHLERSRAGGMLTAATYTIDPNPRSHADPRSGRNVLQGELRNGVITVVGPHIRLEGESPFFTEIDLNHAQLRFRLEGDGRLAGYLGGYQDWRRFLYLYSSNGPTSERDGTDIPGMYHALLRMADAEPDPATGVSARISATYHLEAVPAFLAGTDGAIIAIAAPSRRIAPVAEASVP